jgi:hypothetical protein
MYGRCIQPDLDHPVTARCTVLNLIPATPRALCVTQLASVGVNEDILDVGNQ